MIRWAAFLVVTISLLFCQTAESASPQEQQRPQQQKIQVADGIKVIDLRAPSAVVKRTRPTVSPVAPLKNISALQGLTVKQTAMSLQAGGVNVSPSKAYASFSADTLSVSGKGSIMIYQPEFVISGFINFTGKKDGNSFLNLYLNEPGVFVVDYTLTFVNESPGTEAVCEITAYPDLTTTSTFHTTSNPQHLLVIVNSASSYITSTIKCYKNDGKGLRYAVKRIDVTRP